MKKRFILPAVGLLAALCGSVRSRCGVVRAIESLAVQWPLFTGGRIRANIRLQDARLEQADLEYGQTVLVVGGAALLGTEIIALVYGLITVRPVAVGATDA